METTDIRTFDGTDEALKAMLTEDTGRHMLDSGDHYGRHHEENQGRDFDDEPEATLEFCPSTGEVLIYRSVYHFLRCEVNYDSDADRRLQEHGIEHDLHGNRLSKAFAESLPGASGLYGKGDPMAFNSYNHECSLDQTIQGVVVNARNETLIILQIHGGCDVRGGYTRPRAFRPADDPASVLTFGDGTVSEEGADESWHTDCAGYRWYPNGDADQLQEYDMTTADELEQILVNPDEEDFRRYAAETDSIVVLEARSPGRAFGPTAGGELRAGR